MRESSERVVIVVDGRVLEIPAYRPTSHVRLEDSVSWWESLAVLGGSLLVLGVVVGAVLGSAAAICGFALFLATGVVAGTERYEFATTLGVSGVIWTSVGISLYLGTNPSVVGSLVGFEIVGAAALAAGVLGALRIRSRDPHCSGPPP